MHDPSNVLCDETKATIVSSAYPDVYVVLGDLDAVDVIGEEARKADVQMLSFVSPFSSVLRLLS